MMPTMSRTRRSQDEFLGGPERSILDVFAEREQAKAPQAQAKGRDEPSVEDLISQLAEMNQRLDRQERESAMSDTVRPASPVQTTVAAPQAPQLNLEGLPDPVTDAKGYGAELAKRTVQYQNEMTAFNAQRNAPKAAPYDVNELWNDFQDAYPEYIGNEKGLSFAVGEVAKRLAKKGIDVPRFMATKSETMFKMITEEYDEIFGSPTDHDDDQEQEPAPRKRGRPRKADVEGSDDVDDGDDGRSESVLGAGAQPGTRQGPQKAPGGLIEDLQAIQRKTGYY